MTDDPKTLAMELLDAADGVIHEGDASLLRRAAAYLDTLSTPSEIVGLVDRIFGDLEDPDPSYALKDINAYQDLLRQNRMLRDMRVDVTTALTAQASEIARLREESAETFLRGMAKRLVQRYLADRSGIADLCDEVLDPRGTLLGYVREAALPPARQEKK